MQDAEDDRGDRVNDAGLAPARKAGPEARAALSIEISRLVARVLAGDTIDRQAEADKLARQFPDAGMSGVMVAQAIDSAAGMVGMMRQDGAAEIEAEADAPKALGDEVAMPQVQLLPDAVAPVPEDVAADGHGVPSSGGGEPSEPAINTDSGGAITRSVAAAVKRALFGGRWR